MLNKLNYFWIWFWYNDITRTIFFMGIPSIGLGILFYSLNVFIISYLIIIIWMMFDNDYSNLRKIGMNEYRKKLK